MDKALTKTNINPKNFIFENSTSSSCFKPKPKFWLQNEQLLILKVSPFPKNEQS